MADIRYMPIALDPYDDWFENEAPQFKTESAANIYGLNHYGFGNYEVVPVGEAAKAA